MRSKLDVLSFPFQFFHAVVMIVFFISYKMLVNVVMNYGVCMRCAVVGMGKGVAVFMLMGAKQGVVNNKSGSCNH